MAKLFYRLVSEYERADHVCRELVNIFNMLLQESSTARPGSSMHYYENTVFQDGIHDLY